MQWLWGSGFMVREGVKDVRAWEGLVLAFRATLRAASLAKLSFGRSLSYGCRTP